MTNVVPFPMENRTALVRETVWSLSRKDATAAGRFWQMTINRQRGMLQSSGVLDPSVIEVELQCFADEVFFQLHHLQATTDLGGDAA